MGNFITVALSGCIDSIKCESNCSIHHELDDRLEKKSLCISTLDLKQSDIKIINKIISKSKYKKSHSI
jgi:hypothetical protein